MADPYDLMTGAPSAAAYSGNGYQRAGQALGELFSGGRGPTPAYLSTMSRGAQLRRQLAEAKIKTDEANQRENAAGALATLFPDGDPRAAAYATLLGADYGNFDQVTQGGINLDKQAALRAAQAFANSGDMDQLNRQLMVYKGAPVERTKIAGNTAFDPYSAPDQYLRSTPYGDQLGGAAATRAAAAMYRAENPPPRSSRASSGSPSDPEKAADEALRAAAKDAFYSARAEGQDLYGVTRGDIEHAFRTTGEWSNPNQPQKRARYTPPDTGSSDVQPLQPQSVPASAPAARASGAFSGVRSNVDSTALPPVPGARRAPDGNWYIPDPDRPGKYLRVDG